MEHSSARRLPRRWPAATVSVLAERIFGHGWWLVLYFGCGAIGQMFGYLWEPPDSRASVAGAGLLGAVCAWLLSPAGPRQVRVWGVVWPLVRVALTLKQDQHGPPLLVGFAAGALLLWLDRRRAPTASSRPPARRPRGEPPGPVAARPGDDGADLGVLGFVLRRVIGRVRRSLRAGAGGGMVLP